MGDQPISAPENQAIASGEQSCDSLISNNPNEGKRLQRSKGAPVYLWMGESPRKVPDSKTYTNLFASWDGVQISNDLESPGPDLTSGASLVQAQSSSSVYLATNGRFYFIPNANAFSKFSFDSTKILKLPDVIVNAARIESLP
ncbi:hypothetical protein AB1286_09125 [Trinickia sp. NRRL B-1857]|uniref:hypothetical protein n=1 Tax=Trinickia sp. NRRL B-1857 TaxID=3162879 RepID=UPI003D2DBAE0